MKRPLRSDPRQSTAEERLTVLAWGWVVPILLLLGVLAIPPITEHIYWLDEDLSLYRAMGGNYGPVEPVEMITRITLGVWPPMYYVTLVGFSSLVGWTTFATRVYALFFGLLSVGVVYQIGVRVASRRAGTLAALLLTTSTFFLFYNHEARGYTLYVFLSVLSVWLYLRMLRYPVRRRHQYQLALSLFAAMFTHYIAATTCVAIGLYHLLFVRRNRRWNQIFRSFVYAGVLYVPWLSAAFVMAVGESQFARGLTPLEIISTSAYAFSNGAGVLLLVACAYLVLFVRDPNTSHAGARTPDARFLWFWLIAGFVTALVLNAAVDYLFHIRHILPLIVPCVLLLAIALDDLSRRLWPVALVLTALWVGVGIYHHTGDSFMARLPGQVPKITQVAMDTTQELLDTCVADDDLVIFYTREIDERLNERILYYYLGDRPYPYVQVSSMVNLSGFDRPYFYREDDLPDPYPVRRETLLTSADDIWLLALDTDRPSTDQLLDLQSTLQREYAYCGPVIETATMQATLYSNHTTVTCAAGPVQTTTLDTCRP